MMKSYLYIVGWVAFLAFNYCGLHLIFWAMNYPSDLIFFAGLAGLFLLLQTDILIVILAIRKHQPKGVPSNKTGSSLED
jgi:hypothetical protein